MGCKRFLEVSVSLKTGVLILLVAFLLHVVGLSLPQWSTFKFDNDTQKRIDLQYVYRIGLWKDCLCGNFLGNSQCICISKTASAGSFQSVQALEASGLAVLIFSGIFSGILLLSSDNKQLKVVNICTVFIAAALIVAGCILYAVDINSNNDNMLTAIGYIYGFEKFNRTRLGASFFLCSVAGALSLIVCPSLLVIDYQTAKRVNRLEQFHNMTFPNQDQMISTPIGSVVVQNSGQQSISLTASEAQPGPSSAYPA